MIVASGIDEKTLKRDGVCAASLPTTMGVVAGFLVQNTLKKLLRFGKVSHYLGYNALDDFFPTMALKPNPQCDDRNCVKRQEEWQEQERLRPKEEAVEEKEEEVVHEDNEWHIELVADEGEENAATVAAPVDHAPELAEGVEVAYDLPAPEVEGINWGDAVEAEEGKTLDELMEAMKQI